MGIGGKFESVSHRSLCGPDGGNQKPASVRNAAESRSSLRCTTSCCSMPLEALDVILVTSSELLAAIASASDERPSRAVLA